MHSQSHTATSLIVQVMTPSGTYSVDTSSAEFRSTVDMGSVATGQVTFRTTLVRNHQLVVVEDSQTDPVIAKGGMAADQYLAKQERNPKMAAALRAMRMRLAAERSKHGAPTLPVLRQRAGLSQTQLAAAMETSQPNIARWEKDPEQMTAKTIKRMAAILQVREQAIHDAMTPQPQAVVEHGTD